MGRFMSPDPLQATPQRLLDPQEWNLYSYGRNNPLSLTDPTGLDIWLKGCGKASDTCQHNYVGTTDDNGKFTRTHLPGDQTGDASLGNRGITVTLDGKSYTGSLGYEQGRAGCSAGLRCSRRCPGFTANVTGNCNGTCTASGTLSLNGNSAVSGQAMKALNELQPVGSRIRDLRRWTASIKMPMEICKSISTATLLRTMRSLAQRMSQCRADQEKASASTLTPGMRSKMPISSLHMWPASCTFRNTVTGVGK